MIVALLATSALLCQPPGPNALTGFWESTETSQGGIGHAIEFRVDGRYVEAVTVIVDLHYRLAGDRLLLSADPAPAGDKIPKDTPVIAFEADRLILRSPASGAVEERQRLGASPDPPALAGGWRYRHYTGAIAFERYLPEGRMEFRLPMTSSASCYSVPNHERVNFFHAERGRTQLRYELRDGVLTLKSPDGKSYGYRPVSGGAWYDLENIDYVPPGN